MKPALVRLLRDTSGQDLVEYALLTGVIGFAGLLIFDVILQAIGVTYGSWESSVDSLWDPPAPGAGS
jgi:Flp pilus assembly pilin Flp